ncbi:protein DETOXIFICATION 29-like [Rosa chinensis]|uniref:protein DETOXIFICATION 29-like n=1 Tax=Rosa chinensis TaxID=74649 RepID=UPI001AD92634|nr:protein DETOXIFICATION 29-like [Rosa chinensis]
MEENKQPLLSLRDEVVGVPQHHQPMHDNLDSIPAPANPSFISSTAFNPESDDIPPINGVRDFFREFNRESKKLWFLSGPAIFTSLCHYSLGAITQVFAGHVSTLDLATISVENSVIARILLWRFGIHILSNFIKYVEKAQHYVVLCFLYIFAQQILYGIGQTVAISKAAGVFSIYMIPQLFAYAMVFPLVKFLQSQSKMMVMAVITAVTLILHTVFCWLLMLKLGWGLVGASPISTSQKPGLGFFGLISTGYVIVLCKVDSMGSASMVGRGLSIIYQFLCSLEVWYFMALILFAGYLKNAEVSVDCLSICMNILGWTVMMSCGMNAAISVRVSNELGAGHPRTAKFSLVLAVITSFFIGVLLSLVLILSRNEYPALFPSDSDVQALVVQLTPLLATCIVINNIQPVLSGDAIGAGWQAFVAYVNIGCYHIVGVPFGLLFGYKFDWGVTGIWTGMLLGTVLQTCVLFYLVYKTNWNKEASIAEDRIRKWGGQSNNPKDSENNGATI